MEFLGGIHMMKHLLTTKHNLEGIPAVPQGLGHANTRCPAHDSSHKPQKPQQPQKQKFINPPFKRSQPPAGPAQVNTGGEGRNNRHGKGLEQHCGGRATKAGCQAAQVLLAAPQSRVPTALLPSPPARPYLGLPRRWRPLRGPVWRRPTRAPRAPGPARRRLSASRARARRPPSPRTAHPPGVSLRQAPKWSPREPRRWMDRERPPPPAPAGSSHAVRQHRASGAATGGAGRGTILASSRSGSAEA